MSTPDVSGWGPTTPGPAAFSITGPPQLEINGATRQGSTTFTVTNLTGRPVRARLLPRALQGADPSWVSIVGPPELPMAVGGTLTATLNIAVPPTAPAGSYLLRLDAVPEDDTEAEVEGPAVSFAVPAGATAKGRPKWLLPLIIGIVVLLVAAGAGIYFFTRKSTPNANPSTSTSVPATGTWSVPENLGGTITSGPTVASWAPNRLDVFARSNTGSMVHRAFDGTSWSGPDDRGGQILDRPAAVSRAANIIDIFARGTGNGVFQQYWANGWSPWFSPFDGTIVSSPTVCSWAAGRVDVYARSANNTLIHRWWTGAWSAWEDLGDNMSDSPACISRGVNLLDIFYRGSNDHLFQKSWDGNVNKYADPVDLGPVSSDVAVSSWGQNRMDLFTRSSGSTLLHRWWNGTTWTNWEQIATGVIDVPAAVSQAPGQIDVFARNTSNQLMHMTFKAHP